MSHIKLKLKTPSVPNFILLDLPVIYKQDGFSGSPSIAVGDLDNEQLEEIAKEWKISLFSIASRQRKEKLEPKN